MSDPGGGLPVATLQQASLIKEYRSDFQRLHEFAVTLNDLTLPSQSNNEIRNYTGHYMAAQATSNSEVVELEYLRAWRHLRLAILDLLVLIVMYRISQIWTHLANAEPSLGSEKAARLWSRFYNIFSLTELGRLGDLNDRASLTAEIAEEDKRRATQRINDTQATIEFLEMTVTSYNAFEEELASSYALTTPETAVYLVTFRYIEQHLELPKELNPPMLGNPMMARVAPQLEAKTQTLDATAVAAIKRRTIGAIWKYCSLLFLGLAIVAVFVFRLPLLIIPVALATGIGALIGTIVVWTDPVENLKSQK